MDGRFTNNTVVDNNRLLLLLSSIDSDILLGAKGLGGRSHIGLPLNSRGGHRGRSGCDEGPRGHGQRRRRLRGRARRRRQTYRLAAARARRHQRRIQVHMLLLFVTMIRLVSIVRTRLLVVVGIVQVEQTLGWRG